MLRRRRRRRIEEIPQASLPDLAFLLLIFFITSADIPMEHGLPLLLPSATRSAVVEVEPSEVFHVRGYADGRVTVDEEPVTLERLRTLLQERNAARRAAGKPELIVVIEIQPQASNQLMISILDQVRAGNSRRVSLQMLEGI